MKYIEKKRKQFKVKVSLEKIKWPQNDELSHLVYTKPLIFLSKDLGVSDVAIKKHCKKNGIKTPPAGYWLKQKFWLTQK